MQQCMCFFLTCRFHRKTKILARQRCSLDYQSCVLERKKWRDVWNQFFMKWGRKFEPGRFFMAAHVVLPIGQHLLSWWLNYDFKITCFRNLTFQFMIYVNFAKGALILKKSWFKIESNYHLVKYNILIGYLVENSLLIITEKTSIIFWQTCRAITI